MFELCCRTLMRNYFLWTKAHILRHTELPLITIPMFNRFWDSGNPSAKKFATIRLIVFCWLVPHRFSRTVPEAFFQSVSSSVNPVSWEFRQGLCFRVTGCHLGASRQCFLVSLYSCERTKVGKSKEFPSTYIRDSFNF